MYSDKVKINEKPNRLKLRHGDAIIRSEYNDGVLRNNNRANNRLDGQMKMFDKAQRLILKDLGKEAQIIRSKMTSTSPRHSISTNHIASYSVHGKSSYTIKAQQKNNTPREITNNSTFKSLSDRSMYSLAKEAQRRNAARAARVKPINDNALNDNVNNESLRVPIPGKTYEENTTPRNEHRTDSKLNTFTPRYDRKTDSVISETHRSNQMSANTPHKGGVNSSLAESNRLTSAGHISFIELLQKAEEAKAKGLKVEDHVPRPRTPELLSDYGSDELNLREPKRKHSFGHIGITPKSTYISHQM
ncbi:unnamed protein product [Mytilus coruscus]|uniref:Uncharacterized protein n=1 Tax=Mytilus coruscus TaxID=42192 RepID=A0A6J8E5P5_MYTCO|nr:unnamed protein product [Mytilus coruscus]